MNYPHFSNEELMCQCGCNVNLMDITFMKKLEALRYAFDRPLVLSSAYRCPDHNDNVSSTGRHGPHTTGKAVDIKIAGENAFHLSALAFALGFRGIGWNQKGDWEKRFVHLDTIVDNGRPRIWNY